MPVTLVIAAVVMGIVFYTDYRYREIHNPVVLIILALGVYQHHDILIISNMLFAFMFFLPFWLMGGMGGGDFKLMVALAVLLGVYNSFVVFILGSVPCLIYIAIKKLIENKEAFKAYMRDTVFSLRLSAMGQMGVVAKLVPGESIPLGCWLAIGYYAWLGITYLGGFSF